MAPTFSPNKHLPLGILIGLLLAVAFSLLAFSEPALAPPGCTFGTPGCDAPLNGGTVGQSKNGWLRATQFFVGDPPTVLEQGSGNGYFRTTSGAILNVGGAETGLIVDKGNVGIGTAGPTSRLTVAGGDISVLTQGNGVMLRDTDGADCHRFTVNSAGTLATAKVNCTTGDPIITYSWNIGTFGACSVSCDGGTQSRSVSCQGSNGATVADSFCSGTKPSTSQACNTQSCLWVTSSWGTCVPGCRGGTQTRSVSCQDGNGAAVGDSYCTGTKPSTSQTCNTGDCSWNYCAGEGGTCSFDGTRYVRYGASGSYYYGIFSGSVGCNNSAFGDPIPYTSKSCWYSSESW